MNLDAQYQLTHAVPGDGAIRSYRAVELAAGQEVMVHLLDGDAASIEAQMRDLPAAKRELVLARGVHSGVPCVVTRLLPHGITFDEWLKPGTLFHTGRWAAEQPGSAATQQIPQMRPSAAPPIERGEITKMINPGGSSLPTQALPQMKMPAESAPTQLMPQMAPGGQAPTQMLPQMKAPAAEQGEITKMINPGGSSLPTQALPQVKPPAPAGGPGEFTRMFEQAEPAAAAPPQVKPAVPPPSVPPRPKPVERRQQPAPAAPPKPAAPATPQPGAKYPVQLRPAVPAAANYLPLIYAMAGAIVALLVVVLYLMRR